MDPLPIFHRGDVEYERARVDRVFNLRRPQRYPCAIIEARNESDIIRGVKMARERDLKIAVRSGGHSWAAWSVRHETLLLDLGNLKELSYDTETELAICSPSITGGDLNPYLAQYGRFFAGGHCPTVGIGGFLLQGGQGWWARGWGWSCEQIHSIDVVIPSGELVTASRDENADLFWAARGSGPGFFGIVVRFRLFTRLRPLAMHHVTYIIPAEGNFKDIIVFLQNTCKSTLDPMVEVVCLAFTRGRLFPGDKLQPGKDPKENMVVVRGVSMSNTESAAKEMLTPLLSCPHIDKADVRVELVPTSMSEEYAIQLADNPPGHYFVQNAWLIGEPEDIADSLEKAYTTLPSERSFFLWYSMGPLLPLEDMAFSIQSEHYVAGYIIADKESVRFSPFESEQEHCRTWLLDQFAYIDSKQTGSGGTVGQYLGDSDQSARSAKIMSDENWAKWCSVRDKYDPDGLFIGYMHGDSKLNAHSWEQ